MGKVWVEASLVSAHGLGYPPSLWKRQWFAVGWIDPNCKYCTKVDASGSENPVWKTKFAILVDDSESEINIQDLVLNVEVRSIDPIFLTEKVHGSASVIIKEFLAKKVPNSEVSLSTGNEELRSYQLRKKDSDKPAGFIDISVRILEEKKGQNSNLGKKRGNLTTENGLGEEYSSPHRQKKEARTNIPGSYPRQLPTNDSDTDPDEGRPSYERRRTPPPPPPPSNAGYIPTFLPKNDSLPPPSSGPNPPENVPPGLAMGALIFGDDFMSGFDVPSGLACTMPTDPPS
ncbi:histone-lysine N-methyltransferase, H3 lysine-36 specific-like [Neltuma alba]|uniref:histone-lysine N-methyltransferase, H3 lysine-36 specific-like n=1 Tax=Neltuma alba TaxID=207710 RepID=UPI0010A42959|nr:histone-lysine N-methyltransferase, H3 lysine-36 specific-like [Prosopis alba]XP_028795964.1 histone-lysine N-methyltransferase, H3 lysine-36 specific-like [Prosopis alba]